jgi:hypothetical protein
MKQNPFSLYDFLGYLIPGAMFGYSVVGFWGLCMKDLTPAQTIHHYLGFNRPELYIPLTIMAYVMGHVLSFLSSATVERYALRQCGYPSHYLLGLPAGAYKKTEPPRPTIRLMRVGIDCFLLPISLAEQIFAKLGARELYAKPLDPLLTNLLRRKVVGLLKSEGEIDPAEFGSPTDHDFFRYVYHYAVEHAPGHLPKMQNYVALYGFLRTLAFVAVVDFWLALLLRIVGKLPLATAAAYCGALGLGSFVLFLAFCKFYRRFTLEALMAVAAVHPQEPPGA